MIKSEITGQNITNSEVVSEPKQRTAARPRGLTMLKLQWLAERVRKVERIKKQIEEGTYSADSREVAKRVLGFESTDEV